MTRRTVMGTGLAAAIAPESKNRLFERLGLPIGIQLFPLIPDLRSDFEGTLRKIAAIGFKTVETAGLLGRSAADFRRALDDAGLACRGVHAPGKPLFSSGPSLDTDVDALIADAEILGAQVITVPLFFPPQGFKPAEGAEPSAIIRAAAAQIKAADYRDMADFLNAKGARLAAHGMRLSYHNHNVEFAPADGSTGMDILLRETDPALVDFELDVGWAAVAGADLASLIAAHRGRFTQMHVKDIAADTEQNYAFRQNPAPLGKGQIDFQRLLPLAYAAGTRDFFVEQEPPFQGERIDAMAANYRYLASLRA